jgi:transposase
MNRKKLTDEHWNQIKDHLPSETGRRGRPAKCNRMIINAILWILRTGAPWRDLPSFYGSWNTVYTRFNRWSKKGLWQKILKMLSEDSDDESKMPDSSVIRAHQHAAGAKGGQENQALGRSRGGFSTKIHAVVDALGYPVDLELTPGQVHDSVPAKNLLKDKSAEYIIADKAYDSDELIDLIESQGSIPVIPSRSNRKKLREYDKHIYKERHLVEIFFNKIKQYRRVATRYEKLASNYLTMVQIASCMIWIGF